jgi:hypothetical protein
MDEGPLRFPAPALIRLPRENTVKDRTKIGRTAALVVELDLTVFASTGERRVAQLSRLLQACVVFGTAPKPRSARPESSLAPARPRSGP